MRCLVFGGGGTGPILSELLVLVRVAHSVVVCQTGPCRGLQPLVSFSQAVPPLLRVCPAEPQERNGSRVSRLQGLRPLAALWP